MRPVVVLLSIVSVTFAGTTMYLARELQLERARPHAAPVAQVIAAAPIHAPAATASRLTKQKSADASPRESFEDYNRRMQAEQARRLLNSLADPELREGMEMENKLLLRGSSPKLAQVVGLSKDEAERLFTLLASQLVESQERYSRCMADPACNATDGHLSEPDSRDREIADLLGPERQEKYEAYKNTRLERESVDQLQSRLPDSGRLSFEKSEALITALADERQKIHVEAAQRGAGVSGYGAGVGMVFSASDASTPQAQFESARVNSARLHERASEVLSAEQLRVFDDMQDELLVSMRNQIRRKEESSAGS
jgi:hypothetical protein